MLPAKALYFFYFSSLSCLFPYLNLFFRRLGLTEHSIGLLGAARPFISLPAGSIWSGAADKSRRHKAILLLTLSASVLARLSLSVLGTWGFVPLLAGVAATEFFAAPVTIIVDAAVMAACAERGDYGRQRLWGAVGWGIFAAVSGTAIAHAGIAAAFVGHAVLALATLGPTLLLPFGPLHAKLAKQTWQADDSSAADQQRDLTRAESVAGAPEVSFTLSTAPGQAPADSGGNSSKPAVRRFDSARETESLLRAATPLGSKTGGGGSPRLTATVTDRPDLASPPEAGSSQSDATHTASQMPAQAKPRVRYWRGVAQLLRNPEACIFLAMAAVMGYGVGNIEGYLFLFLDELGGSELLMGLSLTVTCAAETAVFYFLPHMLRLGVRRCLHLVFAAFLVRMGCYAALKYAPSPWLVLPVEALHGLTFATAWGVGCAYAEQLAPPGLEATTQGLFQGLYFGLGVGIGSLCGGYVYQRHGAQAVYISACAVILVGWALCSLAEWAVAWLGMTQSGLKYSQVPVTDVEMNELQENKQPNE